MSRRFTQTSHCRGGRHCGACRDLEGGRAWRASLARLFVLPQGAPDFACPYGKGWGHVPRVPAGERIRPGLGSGLWWLLERVGVHRLMGRFGWTRCGCLLRLEWLDGWTHRVLGFLRKLVRSKR
jgi:hypothetical protein